MKKTKIIITLLLTLLICTSCISASWINFCNNSGKSKWVSTNPDIWFMQNVIITNGSAYPDFEGEINYKNKIIPIYALFGVSYPMLTLYKLNDYKNSNLSQESEIFSGGIKLTKDGFIVTVDERNKDIFDGKYKTITFTRGQLGTPETSS